VTCNKWECDGSACKEYVHWELDHTNYLILKTYGYKVVMTNIFALNGKTVPEAFNGKTVSEALSCSDRDFDIWVLSLSRGDRDTQMAYIKYLIDKFYRWSKRKDPIIESVIKKFEL